MNSKYGTRRSLRWQCTALVCAVSVLWTWESPLAQSGQCTGADLTCLQEDQDPHDGTCLNVSYKRIELAGRDPENMRTGWYAYSHRGGGFRPLDPTNFPVWQSMVEDLNLLSTFKPPRDEVDACLLFDFSSCKVRFTDDEQCISYLHISDSSEECELTLRKLSSPDGSPAQWYGTVPDNEALVPLTVPGRASPQQFPVAAYSRYGGSQQVLLWLELPDAVGIDRVNVCDLRAAYQCYLEGDNAGDLNLCVESFISRN